MSKPPAEPAAKEDRDHPDEEVDLWWGSYGGRAMAPSFAVCIGLTVLVVFAAHWWVPERGWFQLTVSGLASAVWLVQLARFCHRFFTWNYRLTTRYLYVDRGLKPLIAQRFPLGTIDRVEVRTNPLQKRLGVGDIVVSFDDAQAAPAVLEALVAPLSAAETIRDAVKKARPNNHQGTLCEN